MIRIGWQQTGDRATMFIVRERRLLESERREAAARLLDLASWALRNTTLKIVASIDLVQVQGEARERKIVNEERRRRQRSTDEH